MSSNSTTTSPAGGRGRSLRLRRLPALPVEILALILKHLAPSLDSKLYSYPHDLARCCLVSHAFRLAATPFLYSVVRVRLCRSADKSNKSRTRWVKAIASTLDSLKHHTRALIVSDQIDDETLVAMLLPLVPRLTSLQIVSFTHRAVLEQAISSLAPSLFLPRLTHLKLECAEVEAAGAACSDGFKQLLRSLEGLQDLELDVHVARVWHVEDDLPTCRLRRLTLGAQSQAALVPFTFTSRDSLVNLKLELGSGWKLPQAFSLSVFKQLRQIHLEETKTTDLQQIVDQVSTIDTLLHFIILHGTGPLLSDIGFARLPPSTTVLILDLPVHSSEIFQLAWKPEFDRCKIVWKDPGAAWSESDSNVVRQMVLARQRRNEGKEWAATATASVLKR